MERKAVHGLYDELVTRGLAELLGREDVHRALGQLDEAEAADRIARHVGEVVGRTLRLVPEPGRLLRQIELGNELIALVRARLGDDEDDGIVRDALVSPPATLRAIADDAGRVPERPLTPLVDHALLVNAPREPRVGEELRREIPSADRIDLLCAFIQWYGLRVLEEPLARWLASGRPLRVLTTTYMGATEARPLDWLVERGALVKVSYDHDVTRLHAKAWLFHRDTSFSTAWVGSSNLSRSALLDGVEWNVRLAARTTPHLVDKFAATFDAYWNDPGFEPYQRERLQEALRLQRSSRGGDGDTARLQFALLDTSPLPHQREILEALAVERERHGRWKNLVVAATGTGKTVIAALDYRRLREQLPRARLLFVAHRKELLQQSLATFRAVMKDGSFGELFVDGHRPDEWQHVFASVQSLDSAGVESLDPHAFDVVVVDEFHHAAAATYTRLLERLRPRVLLGLTATPERADGHDVTTWFDGHVAAELRLWTALERGLLAPFQYFGVHDDVDLARLPWTRGGYARAALEGVYTGNDVRVAKVLEQLRRRIPDVTRMRALGFCVSVAHARFMADRFNAVGIPALAISAESPDDVRNDALRQLRDRAVNIVFAVDLFNEGVDVPSVDTVLFLRPTESATVFLQQLGRGLRRADDKPCLTVLDFIGAQHRRFRFEHRFAALLGCPTGAVQKHVEDGFPFLPAGCHLELDRVATDVVLRNLKEAHPRRPALVAELKRLGDVDLAAFLAATGLSPAALYQGGRSLTALRREAGFVHAPAAASEPALCRAFERLLHVDDEERCGVLRARLAEPVAPRVDGVDARTRRLLRMLHFVLRSARNPWRDLQSALDDLWAQRAVCRELVELLALLDAGATTRTRTLAEFGDVPVRLHARYDRAEVLTAFDRLAVENPFHHVAGVEHVPAHRADLLFVTLKKSDASFSPTTMYRDYALSPTLFHWESQGRTRAQSETGQRYVHHAARGHRIFLFVRATVDDAFTFLGPVSYVSHVGERPMAVTWRLTCAMPESVLLAARVVAA